ncbi:cytochrome c [Sphingosinicella sp. YJ22]|uniref:cytochrome c n=1 Tax=Sphingosinicella sp. YJ22 TaxID=1104780 RepID=UPI001FAF3E90|nr:cytochrome c [Sphingosinicella sp. YJ22]
MLRNYEAVLDRFQVAVIFCLSLIVTACETPSPRPSAQHRSTEGFNYAQASCGSCHGVGRSARWPNSNAPPFEVIVNREGLTAETLSFWLRGAHNYPREMDFYLGDREVEALVVYMLTLRDPNYRRPPD